MVLRRASLESTDSVITKRDPTITSRIMAAIKSKGTAPEKTLGRQLWAMGLRYRKHYKIAGKPDFVFIRCKIAVFCDGDFWHGHNWKIRGLKSLDDELASYSEFWQKKIRRNIERDRRVDAELKAAGWTVVRVWESDIKRNVDSVIKKIDRVIRIKRRKRNDRDVDATGR